MCMKTWRANGGTFAPKQAKAMNQAMPDVRWSDCPKAHESELPVGFMQAARDWLRNAARLMRDGHGGLPSNWKDDADANGAWSNVVRAYEDAA